MVCSLGLPAHKSTWNLSVADITWLVESHKWWHIALREGYEKADNYILEHVFRWKAKSFMTVLNYNSSKPFKKHCYDLNAYLSGFLPILEHELMFTWRTLYLHDVLADLSQWLEIIRIKLQFLSLPGLDVVWTRCSACWDAVTHSELHMAIRGGYWDQAIVLTFTVWPFGYWKEKTGN